MPNNSCFPTDDKVEISIDLSRRRTSSLTNDFYTLILHENTQAAMRNRGLRYNISYPTAKTHHCLSVTNINRAGLTTLKDSFYRYKITPAGVLV